MASRPKIQVVWFKRDLRVEDHRPLTDATSRGPVLPLFVVEPEWWTGPDMSGRQYAFMAECLGELQRALAKLGQPLIVRTGAVTAALTEIQNAFEIEALWSHAETGNAWSYARDREVGAWCAEHGIPWHQERQDGVIRNLKSRNGWAGRWDKMMAGPITSAPDKLMPLPFESERLPDAAEIGLAADTCPERQLGGRELGLQTLESFLQERGETYRRAMSSPVTGAFACSRMSPHLAWGSVSMREIAQRTWQRQRALREIGGKEVSQFRGSLVSFTGRLHWHCHFMQKLEDEPALEFHNLHRAYDTLRQPEESDAARLAAWCNGETGLPFVDACMRYLSATGWMNFRMRAMLMATASYHLWLHWRQPGEFLARQFTDYEPGIHWPQSQMQSGTTGINTVRIYNPVKQGYDQDPTGEFVRRWVPELRDIPGELVHEPWKADEAAAILDKTYPTAIVDHVDAARQARQRIYGIRRTDTFRDAADAIQSKHGSRKSGMTNTGRRGTGKRGAKGSSKTAATAQMELSLDPSSAGQQDG